jgi:hypothetical protein
LLVRRQALKDRERFWSPPARRVAQAMLPPLLCGMSISVVLALADTSWSADFPIVVNWLLFYGCALHSAGFFMTRGIRWFGWIFIIGAIVWVTAVLAINASVHPDAACLAMGFFFGALHLAYGVYLYFTEKRNSAA